MKFTRRLMQKRWVQKTIGVAAAEYLRLVWITSRFTMEPADPYRLYEREQPVILAMWHGQHFMLPFLRRGFPFKVLISRHIDGEINAIAAEWLGVGTVRGSGDHGRTISRQGRRGRLQEHDGCDRRRLEYGAHRRRSESLARRRARDHQARERNGTADLPGCARHQPPQGARQLGPLGDQPSFQPRRHRRR